MPPKRKVPVETNTQKKKLKFATVLSPTSYAIKQSSPRKTRGGAKAGGVTGSDVTNPTVTQTSTTTNGAATAKPSTRKEQQPMSDTIVVSNTAAASASLSTSSPKTTRPRQSAAALPPPSTLPLGTASDKAVAAEVAQALTPTAKKRATRGARNIKFPDENSPYFTFRAVPLPSPKTATANASRRATRAAPATPVPALGLRASTRTISDDPFSPDDHPIAKESPFLLTLKKAAPHSNPVLTSMTNIAFNPATTATTERDIFRDSNPTIPSRRGRGARKAPIRTRAPAAVSTTPATMLPPPQAPSQEEATEDDELDAVVLTPKPKGKRGKKPAAAVSPPPVSTLPPPPQAPSQEEATGSDELNAIVLPPKPKAKRGRKPAADMTGTSRQLLPEVAAADLAAPRAPATRGRGARGRGSTRGRGRTARGGRNAAHTPEEPVAEFAPIPPPEMTTEKPTATSDISAPRMSIAEFIDGYKSNKRRSSFSGPATKLGVTLLKKHVLRKLSGKGKKRIVGFEDEYRHVHHLLEQTVVSGEGNSMLVIGPRGVGKTTLVDTIIDSLQEGHKGEFLVVRLNGFLQTDDKIAVREIWRQLGVEMDLEDQGGQPKTSNFADTLTSILALLSHPDELEGNAEGDDDGVRKTSLSVVFVLDEFDLFVTHPRQTLLYNLFDIAQARKAPIAVLGLTSRVDVVEGLEKRVKSRFSHRSVHLRLPSSLEQFWSIIRSGLEANEDELGEHEGVGDDETGYWEKWNDVLEGLFEESKGFRKLVRRQFAMSKDVKGFWLNHCFYPVSYLVGVEHPYLTEGMVVSGTTTTSADIDGKGKEKEGGSSSTAAAAFPPMPSLAGPENRLHILPALTELELSLLIAAARLDIITNTDMCNFNMAYEEYKALASKVKVQNAIGSTISGGGVPGGGQGGKLWSREVAVGAWEGLGRWEVLVPANVGGAGVQGGVGRDGRMWRVDVGLAEIGRFAGASGGQLGGVLGKWCREI